MVLRVCEYKVASFRVFDIVADEGDKLRIVREGEEVEITTPKSDIDIIMHREDLLTLKIIDGNKDAMLTRVKNYMLTQQIIAANAVLEKINKINY